MTTDFAYRKVYSESQIKKHLTGLERSSQIEFLTYCKPMFEKESDLFMTIIANARMSLSEALEEFRREAAESDDLMTINSNTDSFGELDKRVDPVDSSTKNVDQVVQSADQEAIDRYIKQDIGDKEDGTVVGTSSTSAVKECVTVDKGEGALFAAMSTTGAKPAMGKEEKPVKNETCKQAEERDKKEAALNNVIGQLKTNLAQDLSDAASREQDALVEQMKAHDKSTESERERQRAKLSAKLNEALLQGSVGSSSSTNQTTNGEGGNDDGAHQANPDAYASSLMEQQKLRDDEHKKIRDLQQAEIKARLAQQQQSGQGQGEYGDDCEWP